MKPRPETKITRQLRLNLLTLAKAYAKAKGKTLGTISVQLYGSRKLLPNLAKGLGSVSIRMYGQLIEDIQKDWPDDVALFPMVPVIFIGRSATGK